MLLTPSGRVLLADFGVAGHLEHTEDFRRSIVGTPAFMSPEMLEGRPYGCETDQWALGCVLFEIMALEPPFAACESYAAVVAAVLHTPQHIQAPPGYSAELSAIVEALLARKPHERPSNTELLSGTVLRAPFNAFLQSLEAAAEGSSRHHGRAVSSAAAAAATVGAPIAEETHASASTPSETGQGSTSLASTWACGLGAAGVGGPAACVANAWAPDDEETPRTRLMHEAEAVSYVSGFDTPGSEYSPCRFTPGALSCTPDELAAVHAGHYHAADAERMRLARMAPPFPSGISSALLGGVHALPSARTDFTASSAEDVQEMSTNVLGNAGVGAGEWRQLLAEAESLLQSGPVPAERLAMEEVAHVRHVRAALCDLLGTEAQVNQALGFLRERRPLDLGVGETVEADELLLQVEVLDLLGDEGLRALPLLERLLALEARSPDLLEASRLGPA